MPVVNEGVLSGGSYATNGTLVTETPLLATSPIDYPVTSGQSALDCAPADGSPLDILAALTDAGRNLLARELVEGLGFRVVGFRVGRGGYYTASPMTPKPLVTSDTDLEYPVFPAASAPVEPIDRTEQPNAMAASFLCRLAADEGVAGLGELGIWVEITYSPTDPTEVGDQYLFALVHRPLFSKTLQDVWVARVVVQH